MKRFLLLFALVLSACGTPSLQLRALSTPNGNDIQLSGGTYGDYTLSQSGTASDPIVVYGNGSTLRCVLITGAYVEWTNTIVTGCPSFGIRVKGAHVKILKNTVTNVSLKNWDGSKCIGDPASWDGAIRIADTTDVLVDGNLVYKVCAEGINPLRSDHVVITNNVVYDAFSVNIYIDQSSFVTVENNWSYSTGDTRFYKAGQAARGLSIGAEIYSGWVFNVHDILINNNTFERVRGINYIVEVSGTPYSVTVRDNQFISVPAPLVSLGAWATVTGNIAVTATGGATAVPLTATLTPRPPTPTAGASASATVTAVTPSATVTASATPTAIVGTATPSLMECYLTETDQTITLVCYK